MKGVYVVGIPVARNKAGGKHLQSTVQLPSGSRTLGMTSKVFLEDTQRDATLALSKMSHLITYDTSLVLVIGNGTCSVHTCNIEIIQCKTPCSQSSTKRSDTLILLPEFIAEHVESGFDLSLRFPFDVLCAITHVCIGVEIGLTGFHRGNLVLEVDIL